MRQTPDVCNPQEAGGPREHADGARNFGNIGGGRWSELHPCPICEHDGWCTLSPDGEIINCMRDQAGCLAAKVNITGESYFVHHAPGRENGPGGKRGGRASRPRPAAPSVPRRTREDIDAVYRALIDTLPPASGGQRRHLLGRGLTDDAIARHGLRHFGAFGNRERCVERLSSEYDLRGVPGFWRDEKGWRLGGWSGLSIPVRAFDGLITGIALRPDEAPEDMGKYCWLSSSGKAEGTSQVASAHVPLFAGDADFSTVRVTEGALKAIVAYELSGVPTIGMSSCGPWVQTLPALEHFRPARVLLALDADHVENPAVAVALADCFAGLTNHGRMHGYDVAIERWDLTDTAKGIDDLLKAGGEPERLSGADADAYVAGLKRRPAGDSSEDTMNDTRPESDGADGPDDARPDLADRVKAALKECGMEGLYGDPALMAEVAGCDQFTLARVRAIVKERRASLGDFDAAVASFARPASGPAAETPPYAVEMGCICQNLSTKDGVIVRPLANYDARIVEQIAIDDGVRDPRQTIAVEGSFADGRPLPRKEVPAEAFDEMKWAGAAWAAGACIEPGMKEQLRAGINYLSGVIPTRTVYGHIGWRLVNGVWLYLHVGGAIGAAGPVEGVCVQVPERLKEYVLPPPPSGKDLWRAVNTSLTLLSLGPDAVTLPLLAAVYRAPLGRPEHSAHVAGPTGAYKSGFGGLLQQHFGAGWGHKRFPASWSDTAGTLELLGSCAADALFVIDEFRPCGGRNEVDQLHSKADRVIRAAANGSARGRMDWKNKGVHADYIIRGQILSTGEDTPRGQSLRARMTIIQAEPGSIGPRERIISASEAGRRGVFSSAMSGYIRWLAEQRDADPAGEPPISRSSPRLEAACSGGHARTLGGVAGLFGGWCRFIEFAVDCGAIGEVKAEELYKRGEAALASNAADQAAEASDEEESARFLRLVYSAIDSGKAHILGRDGNAPPLPGRYGWRKPSNAASTSEVYEASGECIGWVGSGDVFLDPEAAFTAAQKLAVAQGCQMTVGQRTLWKRLEQHKHLKSVDSARNRNVVRKTLCGVRREVLHVVWRDGGENRDGCADSDE